MAIDLDDESTWPGDVLKNMVDLLPMLEAYEKDPPRQSSVPHELSDIRDQLIKEIGIGIQDSSILGFHCCRLVQEEIEIVKLEGVHPASDDLFRRKLRILAARGDITDQEAETLSVIDLKNRLSSSWLFGEMEEAMDRHYLQYWGGEALSVKHIGSPLGERLRSIGEPCVIEAAFPVNNLPDAPRWLLEQFERHHRLGPGASGQTTASEPVLGVRRVLMPVDADFQRLTKLTSDLC